AMKSRLAALILTGLVGPLLAAIGASAADQSSSPKPPAAGDPAHYVGTRSTDGDRATFSDPAGRTSGTAATSGDRTTFRDSSGRSLGTASTSGNHTTFRDSSGRTAANAATSGDRTTFRDSSGRATGTVKTTHEGQ